MQYVLSRPQAELIFRIVRFYGAQPIRILDSARGYRNLSAAVQVAHGEIVNVILFKREAGIVDTIRRGDSVSNFLAERGFPSRHSLSEKMVQIGTSPNERYARIYDYLPGFTIPWESYSRGHIVSLGMMMSTMHAQLRRFDKVDLPNIETKLTRQIGKVIRYFQDPAITSAVNAKLGIQFNPSILDTHRSIIEQAILLNDRQPLHMDFVRGNILFDGQKIDKIPNISGVLDFEKTAIGNPLFDVARTAAFLLVDCKYKQSEDIMRYFLESGYVKRGVARLPKISVKIGSQNHDLLTLLLDYFLIYDLYKFLKHNPYESLPDNEHYIRTRDILVSRGLVGYHTQSSLVSRVWSKLLRKHM